MLSKWYELKPEAIRMRENGSSIREIEKLLKIPRSTLSGWLKNIKLTTSQKTKLAQNWQNALGNAREKALIWHHSQKEKRLKEAEDKAAKILENIDQKNKNMLELALAMLYLGEGDKTNITSMGNSNPLILKFFIKVVESLFNINKSDIRCDIHLRSDQNEKKAVQYWSNELGLPPNIFSTYKDKRIAKTRTYANYKGVCVIKCGKIAVQRELVSLSEQFCKRLISLDP